MNTKTIYLVYSKELDAIEDVVAVFDNKELVDEFLDRFKDWQDEFELREMTLNQQYRGDKTRNPYCVSVHMSGGVNIYPAFYPRESEMAFNNEYETFGFDDDHRPAYLDYFLLSETREEALAEGMARVEKLVTEGVFKIDGKLKKDNF